MFQHSLLTSTRAVALDSLNFPNFLNMGIAHYNMEEYLNAVFSLERAVQLSPNSDEAHYYLGQTFVHLDERMGLRKAIFYCIEGPGCIF